MAGQPAAHCVKNIPGNKKWARKHNIPETKPPSFSDATCRCASG